MQDQMEIPEITDPLGRYWEQPARNEIELTDLTAVMSKATFDKLKDYSYTTPSGVYPGKMWKRSNVYYRDRNHKEPLIWHLRWYGHCDDPTMCSNHSRLIVIIP